MLQNFMHFFDIFVKFLEILNIQNEIATLITFGSVRAQKFQS